MKINLSQIEINHWMDFSFDLFSEFITFNRSTNKNKFIHGNKEYLNRILVENNPFPCQLSSLTINDRDEFFKIDNRWMKSWLIIFIHHWIFFSSITWKHVCTKETNRWIKFSFLSFICSVNHLFCSSIKKMFVKTRLILEWDSTDKHSLLF